MTPAKFYPYEVVNVFTTEPLSGNEARSSPLLIDFSSTAGSINDGNDTYARSRSGSEQLS